MKTRKSANRIKTFVSVFISLAIILSAAAFDFSVTAENAVNVWDGSEDYEFEGSGAEADPYKITSAAELYGFVKRYCGEQPLVSEGKYFELTSDIYLNDISDKDWMYNSPREWAFLNIWTINAGVEGFRGSFDGNGYTVYGMYYANPNEYAAVMGLIPMASGSAFISNVNIRYAYINKSSYEGNVGAIVGFVNKNADGSASDVKISKCVADSTVDFSGLTNSHAGGIVGPVRESGITVEYCGSSVKFNNEDSPAGKGGGILANANSYAAESVSIKNSYTTAAFTSGLPGSDYSSISDGTLYSARSWWKENTNVNMSVVSNENMLGGKALLNMPLLGWDIWQANDGAYPTIKGSTNYIKPEADDTETTDIWDGGIAAGYAGGTGSVNDPYLISTPEQLRRMVMSPLINQKTGIDETGKYYLLTNDIYLNDISGYGDWVNNRPANNWLDYELRNVSFVGHIDGNGYTIYGLLHYENSPELDINMQLYAGLIPNIGVNSSITDLHIRKSLIRGEYAGAFIGSVGGTNGFASDERTVTVSGCSVDDSVQVYGLHTGGFAGVAQASLVVNNSYSSAVVAGDLSYGGIYGDAWGGAGADHTFINVYSVNAYPIALSAGSNVGKVPDEDCRSYVNVYSIYDEYRADWEGIKSVSSFTEMSGLDAPYWYGTDVKQLVNRGARTFDINADGSDAPDSADMACLRKSLLYSEEINSVYDCNKDGKFDILDLIRIKKAAAGFFM